MAKKRKKAQIKAKKTQNKRPKKSAAFILAVIGILFLLVNAVYLFVAKDQFIQNMQGADLSKVLGNISEQDYKDVLDALPSALDSLAVLWIIIAAFAFYIVQRLERGASRWWLLLVIGVLSIILGRIDTFILFTISSILYKTKK
jgi:ABC-type Fe3+ transport system permease subunit